MPKKLIELVYIVVGTFILAISVEYFILPFNILSGGVAGIAVALEPFFHFNRTLVANILVISLLIVGGLVLGKDFLRNTIISSLCYPVFTTLLSYFPIPLEIDPLLASFYAGLIGGAGIGIVMRTGASTGGMDIPPLILNKLTGAKISTMVMITDALTIFLGIMAFGISAALIGLVSVFASGFAISRILDAGKGNKAKSVQIISDSWKEINEEINNQLNRGSTIIEATGSFSNDKKEVLLVVVAERQYNQLLNIIRDIDEKAFVITTDASDMHGEGFTYASPNI